MGVARSQHRQIFNVHRSEAIEFNKVAGISILNYTNNAISPLPFSCSLPSSPKVFRYTWKYIVCSIRSKCWGDAVHWSFSISLSATQCSFAKHFNIFSLLARWILRSYFAAFSNRRTEVFGENSGKQIWKSIFLDFEENVVSLIWNSECFDDTS